MKRMSIAAALVCVLMLAGCTPGGGSGVKLRFAFWGSQQQDLMQELADAFHEEHPDITVQVEFTPYSASEYWTRLEASAAGGSAPDVFWMNGVYADTYIDGGMMLDLTDMVEKSSLINWDEDYPETLAALYTRDGRKYAVPKDFDTNAVWYNKQLFDEAGVEYPQPDWTWEDMVAIAEKLTDPARKIWGITAEFTNQQYYYNTITAHGGYILADDMRSSGYADPGTIAGIQCWIDLINAGLSPSLASLSDTSSYGLFESGKLAMVWAGSYWTSQFLKNELLAGNVGVAPLPSVNGKRGNCINGLGIGVYSKTKHKEAALLFAEWLGGRTANEIQGRSGAVIPARYDCQNLYVEALPQINAQAYLDQVEDAALYPCSKVTSEMQFIEVDRLRRAWTGEISVADACREIAQAVDPLLAQAYP